MSGGDGHHHGDGGNRSSTEFKLKYGPEDGISRVRFGPNSSQFLLSSSWDCTLRLYDVVNNTLRVRFARSAPLLDCCFQDPIHVWSGGLDSALYSSDINSSTETAVGSHDNAVRSGSTSPYTL